VEGHPVRVVRFMDSDMPGEIVNDFTGWDSDYASTYRAFKGRKWSEISFELLQNAGFAGVPFDMYNFLTDEAFRYYLPAWIVIALNEQNSCPDILELLCSSVKPYRFGQQLEPSFNPRYEVLPVAQKKIIAQVLQLAAEALPTSMRIEAQEATNAYWSQYL